MHRISRTILFVLLFSALIPTEAAISVTVTPARNAHGSATASPPFRPATTPDDVAAIEAVLADAVAVAAGGGHSCVITPAGGVKCWGWNAYGQLGDGTLVDHLAPSDVSGLTSGVSAIALGALHTCALLTDGSVKCWGWNGNGQLGDGTTTDHSTPVDVVELGGGVRAIAVGSMHSCGVLNDGTVKCWGHNDFYQLGDGTSTDRWTPVSVIGLSGDAKTVAAGIGHTCVALTAGGAQCWGLNGSGQLGDGTNVNRSSPTNVTNLAGDVRTVVAEYDQTCAVTSVGEGKCWGANESGQLGDGSMTNRSTPVDVVGLASGVQSIAVGAGHTCALLVTGGAECWGRNDLGQMGSGATSDYHLTPGYVTGLTDHVLMVAAGGNHNCALLAGGNVRCWGGNHFGELGDGMGDVVPMPVVVAGLSGVAQDIVTGFSHTCALMTDGGVQCWGQNLTGQLGDGATVHRWTAAGVIGLESQIRSIVSGWFHSCAVTTSGAAKCWGRNDWGQLGNGAYDRPLIPVDVIGLTSEVQSIATGSMHTCAALSTGRIQCWGWNGYGQLGDGTTTSHLDPVSVKGLGSGAMDVAAGDSHTCALLTTGGVQCWGANLVGQLGDGTNLHRSTPVNVIGLSSGVKAVATKGSHACALTEWGGVKCWGGNSEGELGDGTLVSRSEPVDVVGLSSGVEAIAVGIYHSCALLTTGGVKCWGSNTSGQLGEGTTTNRTAPVYVTGLSSGIQAIAAGNMHTCAITTAGKAKCWGYRAGGQVGVNPGWLPIDVVFPAPLPADPDVFAPYLHQ